MIVLAVLALVLGGCRTSQPLEVKTGTALQTNSQPDAKVVIEKPSLTGRIDNVKTSENALSNNKASLTIHFKDSRGNPYQTPKSVIGTKAA
jgi:uncharacterized protein YcfL